MPAHSAQGPLLGLTADGVAVSTATRTVKGVEYAVFPAAAASYVATYPGPPAARKGRKRTMVRATRRGRVRLLVTCRRTRARCGITVRLRHRAKVVARAHRRVAAGKRGRVTLRLPHAVRRKLARRRTLRMTAVIAGHRAGRTTATRRLRVVAADRRRSSRRRGG